MTMFPQRYVPLGFVSGSPTVATTLSVPAGATHALISAITGAAFFRDDGTAPTATAGISIPAGTTFEYSGNLAQIQIIQATGTLNVSFYKQVG